MIGILKHLYRVRKSENLRASFMKKYAPCKIGSEFKVSTPENLKLGKYIDIQRNCHIAANGGVSIGNYTQISENFTVFSDEHLYDIDDYIPISNLKIKKPVIIEDFVIIGANVSILPGVNIGRGSIIGMGAVVINSIPPFSIALGNPARVIKKRDVEQFQKLLVEKKYFQNIEGALDYEYRNQGN